MPGTKGVLSELFTEQTIINKVKGIPQNNIYASLVNVYQKKLVPILSQCTRDETDTWDVIANYTKTQAIQLIKSKPRSCTELLQIVRFQRALWGKEPYRYLAGDNFSIIKQPLTVFLRRNNNNQLNGASRLSSIQDTLSLHWVPYSILFEKLGEDDGRSLTKEEILEILTAIIIEEPSKFQHAALKSSLQALTDTEIVELFKYKKLSSYSFKTVFTAIFNSSRSSSSHISRELFSKSQFAKILAYQPESFKYFYEKFPDKLLKFTNDQLVEILTWQNSAHYQIKGYYNYCYLEEEFYETLVLINQKDPEFFTSLSSEALVKILCRLEFSALPSDRAKNRRSEAVFNVIQDNMELLAGEAWLKLLLHADSTVIERILSSPLAARLIGIINNLSNLKLKQLFAGNPPIVICSKTLNIIYPHFILGLLDASQKTKLIITLAEHLTEQNYARIVALLSRRENFSADDLGSVVTKLNKNDERSIQLLKILFQNYYNRFDGNHLLKFCQENTQVAMLLFTHEVNTVKQYVFDKLKIVNFAEIAVKASCQSDVQKLLEVGLIKKVSQLPPHPVGGVTAKKVSQALSCILQQRKAATDVDTFNFIYNNKEVDFLPYITTEHLVISFSHKLITNDVRFKLYLARLFALSATGKLKQDDLFQIFLEAQKNDYVLPAAILNLLIIGAFRQIKINNEGERNFITQLHGFLSIKSLSTDLSQLKNSCYSEQQFKHVYCSFILEAYRLSSIIKMYSDHLDTILNYLEHSQDNFITFLIANQANHPYLPVFLSHSKVISLLKPADVGQIFLLAEKERIFLPTVVKQLLITQLLKKDTNLSSELNFDVIEQIYTARSSVEQTQLKKAEAQLLIEIHQQVYQRNHNKHSQLINYLTENRLCWLVKYQSKHHQLIKLFKDHLLLVKLTPEIAQKLLIANPLLPSFISQKLFNCMIQFATASAFKDTIVTLVDQVFFDRSNAKVRSAFLLEAFKYSCADQNLEKFLSLINYFTEYPEVIAAIFLYGINQEEFNFDAEKLLHLIQNPQIIAIFSDGKNCQHLESIFFNTVTSQLNLNSQILITAAILPNLTQGSIIQIFLKSQIQGVNFDYQIKKMLVGKLNFRRLHQLIHQAKNNENNQVIKLALLDICATQIQRQKEFFIPEFISKFLIEQFQSFEVSRMKQSKFEYKSHLAQIADEQLVVKQENPLVEVQNMSARDQDDTLDLFDEDTGEIKPLLHPSTGYVYLFAGEKKRLKLKADAVATEINEKKIQGGVFWQPTDKRKYFINQNEYSLTLPDLKKQELNDAIEESKNDSRHYYGIVKL